MLPYFYSLEVNAYYQKETNNGHPVPAIGERYVYGVYRHHININFSVIGQVSPNCSPYPKPFHKERHLLNMSRVSTREEDRNRRSVESFLSVPPAMEYITNVSTRKVVYSSGK